MFFPFFFTSNQGSAQQDLDKQRYSETNLKINRTSDSIVKFFNNNELSEALS